MYTPAAYHQHLALNGYGKSHRSAAKPAESAPPPLTPRTENVIS